MKRLLTPAVGAILALTTAACMSLETERSISTPFTPTAPTTTPGGVPPGPLVGTWESQQPVAFPSVSSCSNFSWQIQNQTPTTLSGTFTATCDGGVEIAATAAGTLASGTTVNVTVSGAAAMTNFFSCPFTLSGLGTIIDNSDALSIPYTGTTCFGPIAGTETLRRKSTAPPPAPPVTPPPGNPGPGGDDIDVSSVAWQNSPRDLSSWPATAKITQLNISSAGIRVEFTKKDGGDRWPNVTPPGWDGPLQYTLGMTLNIGGRWYGSAVVEYWHELERSGGPPSQYAINWFYDPARWGPMSGHQPAPGEIIGFFVCAGDCRNNVAGTLSPVKERSNVVLVPMPTDSGAVYNF